MTFDEALSAYVRAVEGAGVLTAGCSATVLRDLRGVLRLYLVGRHQWADDTKSRLQAAVRPLAPHASETIFLNDRSRSSNRIRRRLAERPWFR